MKKNLKNLKNKVWKQFSRYIRYRDGWNEFKSIEKARCCTCNKIFLISNLQAGHFIQGRGNSVLFDERGVHAQCVSCNIFSHGNLIEYYSFMKKKYGEKVIEELKALRYKEKKFSILELETMYDYFVKKNKEYETMGSYKKRDKS